MPIAKWLSQQYIKMTYESLNSIHQRDNFLHFELLYQI